MHQQALGGGLVLAEAPDRPEIRQEWPKPALRSCRKPVGPALLRDLGRIPLGNRPSARWIHDQGASAGDQPLVVRGIIPGRRVWRIKGGDTPAVVERLSNAVGLDRD